MKPNKVQLGTCKSVHGIKGAVVFNLFNDESSVLSRGMTVYPTMESTDGFKITSINFTNKVIVYLEGIDDRNKSEELVPFDIYIDRSDFPEPKDDEVYLNDIIGFKVYDEDNKEIGVINSFYDHGASEIVVIKLNNGEELELPFVKAFFPELDIENNRVTLINPEVMWKREKSGY